MPPDESDRPSSNDLPPKSSILYPTYIDNLQSNFTRTNSDAALSRPVSIAGTDDGGSEDYDWSGEDDLVDEEARFAKKLGLEPKPDEWVFKRIAKLLLSTLIGSLFITALVVLPALIVHYVWYKSNPSDHRLYVDHNVQSWLFWIAANIIVSWMLGLIIDLVPVVSRAIISAVWGHVSEYVKTRIETYDSVKDTAKPAFYAAGAYASWVIIFADIYKLYDVETPTESRASYTNRLAQVVQFFFLVVLVWCVQRLVSHLIAFSFHRTAYKERVEAVEGALAVIEKLRNYRPKSNHVSKSGTRTPLFSGLGFGFGMMSPVSDRESFHLGGKGLKLHPRLADGSDNDAEKDVEGECDDVGEREEHMFIGELKKKKQKKKCREHGWFSSNASADFERSIEMVPFESTSAGTSGHADGMLSPLIGNENRYTSSVRHGVDGTYGDVDRAFLQAAKAIKSAVLHDARGLHGENTDVEGLTWNVNSAHEAKRLAKSIYMRFKDKGRRYLIPADFHPAFHTPVEAEGAFRVFDKDNNGDLSRAEIKTTLMKVYKERHLLSRSMRDVSAALKTLDRILVFFASVILFFIALSVFGVNVGKSLSSFYTLGVAASFVFKNAASSAFDAITFLFVTHPYDTGDRCIIDNENLIVKRVGLFATEFVRSDGTETYYFNSVLFTKFIANVRRSGKMAENLTLQVAWRTPLAKLDALENCLNEWLSTEENRWFEPSTNLVLGQIIYQRYLEITIGIGHNGNWQDWGLRNARKTAFHAAVQYYCKQLGIVGYESPLPIVYVDAATGRYEPSNAGEEGPENTQFLRPRKEQGSVAEEGREEGSMERDEESGGEWLRKRREDEGVAVEEREELDCAAKAMKPNLGFLPPLSTRSTHLARARKSKRKGALFQAKAV